MKSFQSVFILVLLFKTASGQMPIRDKHITHQQERMVFKQWDKNKFTPKKGFLGLNPLYWLTWGLHPDYPNTDLRPLSSSGPQTKRLALVVAMHNMTKQYKMHADTLRSTALSEAINYSGLVSDADPLWILYYRNEFAPLLNQGVSVSLDDLSLKEKEYLLRNGIYEWYLEESAILSDRLRAARTTTLDRGSRMITYHRLLSEFRKLNATWETKKANAAKFLSMAKSNNKIKSRNEPLPENDAMQSDKEIADKILSKSKLYQEFI